MDSTILKKIANYCVYQERSHKEVLLKLKELEVITSHAEEYIQWLVGENYLNEERFARVFSSSKFRLNDWGKSKIQYELKIKGLSDTYIKKGLSEISEEDYREKIQELISKKTTEIKNTFNPLQKKQKVLNYLLSKGFESSEVLPFLK
ncbi:MAG: regulatory protein RecX [Leadbetterella sp.]